MEDFVAINQQEILATTIAIVVLLIIKFISTKAIRRISRISELNSARTRLIIKYISIALFTIGIVPTPDQTYEIVWHANSHS